MGPGAGDHACAGRRQDSTTANGQPTSATHMARSARPVIPPLVISSTRYQVSSASKAPTPAAETAGRSPHGTEVPRRHAPTGQAIRAVKAAVAHSPWAREPPACSGFTATSRAAAPAAARISRPAGAAGRSARAVAMPQAPVTANAAIVTQRSAPPSSVRALPALGSQLKDEGCSAVAAVHPPTRATKAAGRDDAPPRHGARGEWSVVRDGDGDVDVAAGGVRVRAHLVSGVGQRLSLVVGQVRDDDLELHGQLEPALAVGADGDAAADGRVVDRDLLRARDA